MIEFPTERYDKFGVTAASAFSLFFALLFIYLFFFWRRTTDDKLSLDESYVQIRAMVFGQAKAFFRHDRDATSTRNIGKARVSTIEESTIEISIPISLESLDRYYKVAPPIS